MEVIITFNLFIITVILSLCTDKLYTLFQIVLDVQDFTNGGNIKVKAVNDREIVVEGHIEKEKSGSKYKQQFHRRFVLPLNICLDAVSSVMSSDGVLTIMAPKKVSFRYALYTDLVSLMKEERADFLNRLTVMYILGICA